MRESIHKYFKLGIIQLMSYPAARCDILSSLKKTLCDDYFDLIEIGPINDPEIKKEANMLLAQSHLKVFYAAQPALLGAGLNPNAIDEAARQAAENALFKAIDEAEAMGAKELAFLSGNWEDRESAYSQLLKTTRNVCSYAAKKGITVELEVFDYDMDKKSLIGPAPLAARFAADIRTAHSNFGLLADLSHFPTTYETSRFVIQTLRPYITHFHIGNAVIQKGCDAYGDLHPRFGYPNSANDIPELLDFFEVLKAEGFFCAKSPHMLSFEVQPRPGEDPGIIVANTKRVINRAWALLED